MSRYTNNIKVICPDSMCFPVNPITLEALGCSCYIPSPWTSHDEEIEKISYGEWNTRKNASFYDLMLDRRNG